MGVGAGGIVSAIAGVISGVGAEELVVVSVVVWVTSFFPQATARRDPSARAAIRPASFLFMNPPSFGRASGERRPARDMQNACPPRGALPAARKRLASATTLLSAMIDDAELLDELDDLGRWLAEFPAESWVEVD